MTFREKIAPYLPSKKFRATLAIGIGFIVLALAGNYIYVKKAGLDATALKQQVILNTTLSDITETDSNGNGIPDWEESLWGLDPTCCGAENKAFIDAKKAALGASAAPAAEAPLSETDRFSREFFTVIMSLQQSGELNDQTLSGLAQSISSHLSDSTKDLYDAKYTQIDLTQVPDPTQQDYNAYGKKIRALAKKYSADGLGLEMQSVTLALTLNDPRPLEGLPLIAQSYSDFAQAVLKIPVPTPLIATDLELINSADIISRTLTPLSNVLDDELDAIPAIVAYNKQEAIFYGAITRLNSFFSS